MPDAGEVPWRIAGDGRVMVRVRLTPKSSKDAIEGIEGTAEGAAFKARVRAVPQDGAANAALERLFSDWLGVPKSSVGIESGSKARVKTVAIAGDRTSIEARLRTKLAQIPAERH